MTKLDGKTPDLAAENIEQLRQIFPDVFEEGKIDFDKLKQVLGEYVDDEKERYNFTWNGKGKALRLAQTPTTGTLRPCEVESKNWDDTQNLYIEGDNLEVLKLLQKSYHGKIKMIYIDPPYNTGGDFVYPDDFSNSIENYKRITGQVDEEGQKLSPNTESNGRFHTDWLNMMYPRIRLARNLLSDDGVLFVSLDDNEIVNANKIISEIFGENNFVGNIVVKSNPRGSQSEASLAKLHEYIIVYAKDTSRCGIIGHSLSDDMENEYKYQEGTWKYRLLGLRQRGGFWRRSERPNLYYPLYVCPETGMVSLEKSDEYRECVMPIQPSTGEDGTWRWGKDKVATSGKDLLAKSVSRGGKQVWDVFQKDYLDKDGGAERRTKTKSLWDEKEINYQNGTIETKNLVGSGTFDYAKPVYLVQRSIEMMGFQPGEIVLDFFSGSATAAHAVMKLNAEDGGNRKFIMVQLPEPCAEGTEAAKADFENICEIGKERIRRAGEKIKAEIEERNAQLKLGEEPRKVPDIGFKVFKLDSSNLKQWQPDYDNLETTLFDSISNYVDGRSELDVVYEIMLKMGMELTWPLETHTIGGKNVYEIGMGALMICLDDQITTEVAEGMAALYKELAPETWRVVFKDNGFADDSAKVNIKEILKTAGLEEDAFTTV